VRQGVRHRIRAVDRQRQGQQRQRHDEGRPHGHRQPRTEAAVRARTGGRRCRGRAAPAGGPTGRDVADRPRGRRGDDEHQPERRGGHRAAHGDHAQPDRPDQHPDDLGAAGPLAQGQRRDHHGEPHLRLQHQRGETGRHPDGECGVEQRELAQAHEQPDGHDVAPGHQRARHERDGGHEYDDEAQGHEQGGRQVTQPEVDDDEVGAPDHRDEHGEGDVAGRHPPILAHLDREAPAISP